MSNVMHTEITSGDIVRKKLLDGVNKGANVVGSTMGAQGNLVLISKGGLPDPQKDGVTVAEGIFLEDPVESLAWETAKEAARKTVDESGDSTTATMVLLQAFLTNSFKALESGESAIEIKHKIEKSRDLIAKYLDDLAIEVNPETIYQVAKTSSNGDDEIAKLVADAFEIAGENGSVGHVRSNNDDTFLEHTEGTLVERGFISERFVNVHSTQSVLFENNPFVLVSNIKFLTIKQIAPFLEYAIQKDRELLVISEMEYNVEESIILNKVKYGHKFCVINTPAIGKKREELLNDLSLVCGTETITSLSGQDFNGKQEIYLGVAKSVLVTKDNTVIVKHQDVDSGPINGKIEELKELIRLADKNYILKKNLQDRVAKLSGGISMIKVGGIIPSEVEEKIARVDDAIWAVRSSIEEGVIAGGGMALLSAIDKLDLDEVTKKSISAPFRKILENADVKYESLINKLEYPIGYDVKDFKTVNMFDAGIIDSKKSIKNALINSISASNTLLRSANVLTYTK